MIRLAFHDAATFDRRAGNGGVNGSIRYELDRPESFGLKRGVRAMNKAIAKSPFLARWLHSTFKPCLQWSQH